MLLIFYFDKLLGVIKITCDFYFFSFFILTQRAHDDAYEIKKLKMK